MGEWNGVGKSGYGVIMFGRLLEEYSMFLYLRVELAHNSKKVRSLKHKSVFDILISILKSVSPSTLNIFPLITFIPTPYRLNSCARSCSGKFVGDLTTDWLIRKHHTYLISKFQHQCKQVFLIRLCYGHQVGDPVLQRPSAIKAGGLEVEN